MERRFGADRRTSSARRWSSTAARSRSSGCCRRASGSVASTSRLDPDRDEPGQHAAPQRPRADRGRPARRRRDARAGAPRHGSGRAARMQEQYPDVYPKDSGWGIEVVPCARTSGGSGGRCWCSSAPSAWSLLSRGQRRQHDARAGDRLREGGGHPHGDRRRPMAAGPAVPDRGPGARPCAGAALGLLLAWPGASGDRHRPGADSAARGGHLDPPVIALHPRSGGAHRRRLRPGAGARRIPPPSAEVLKEGGRTSAGDRAAPGALGAGDGAGRPGLVVLHRRRADGPELSPAGAGRSRVPHRGHLDLPGVPLAGGLSRRRPGRTGGAQSSSASRRCPGSTAGAISHLPLGVLDTVGEIEVQGRAVRPEEGNPTTGWRMVDPGYFRTMGIPVVAGRAFSRATMPVPPAW